MTIRAVVRKFPAFAICREPYRHILALKRTFFVLEVRQLSTRVSHIGDNARPLYRFDLGLPCTVSRAKRSARSLAVSSRVASSFA